MEVELFAPNASPELQNWLARYKSVNLDVNRLEGDWRGYGVKPHALQVMLARGHSNVVWLDSDILVCGDIQDFFKRIPYEDIVATEEALCDAHGDPDSMRARLWGLDVGRSLPFSLNTSVLRVTSTHAALLARWRELLDTPAYRKAQLSHYTERPPHLLGDQEVLTALLSSKEFSDLPVSFLYRGKDIIQYFGPYGYTVKERLGNLYGGMPKFIHSQAHRPWWPQTKEHQSMHQRFVHLYMELSPYTMLARNYAAELHGSDWLSSGSIEAKMLRSLSFDQPQLLGMPLAIAADLTRLFKWFFHGSPRRPRLSG